MKPNYLIKAVLLVISLLFMPLATNSRTLLLQEVLKKAEQGDAKAQFNLGLCYDKGEGVAKDVAEAVKWYRKAADQGVAAAQYNLGVCYQDGDGVTKDACEAVKWYLKAADQGDVRAQCSLGVG